VEFAKRLSLVAVEDEIIDGGSGGRNNQHTKNKRVQALFSW